MSKLKSSWGLVGLATVLGLLFLVAIISAINIWAGPTSVVAGWTPLFADPFTSTTVSLWTVSDTVDGAFHWDIVPYTRTLGTAMIGDSGFWVAGGGSSGGTLTWPEGTYANNMTTWAVAGPFTPTQKVWGVRLRFQVQNRVAPSDTLFVGLSYDNVHFTGITLTEAFTDWRELIWAAPVYTDGLPIWVMLHFVSDEEQVEVGPLVDNFSLEANYGYGIYLPLVRLDPTPTPTPTPIVVDYYDNFDIASSGWITHQAACCLSGCDNGELRENPEYKYSLYYESGRYHVNIPKDCRAPGGSEHGDTRHIYPVSLAPEIERPDSETCIQMRGGFEEWDPWWSFWGLVFAASDDLRTVYSIEVNNLGSWGIVRRTGYQYPGPNHPFLNETRTYIVNYTDGGRWPAVGGFKPNSLKAQVGTNEVKLYINGEQVHVIRNSSYVNEIRSLRRVGIIGGDWEVSPTQIGYDYFFVDEDCDTY